MTCCDDGRKPLLSARCSQALERVASCAVGEAFQGREVRVSFADAVRAVRRHVVVFVLIIALGCLAGVMGARFAPRTYTGTSIAFAQIRLPRGDDQVGLPLLAQASDIAERELEAVTPLFTSEPVLEAVTKATGYEVSRGAVHVDKPQGLAVRVHVTAKTVADARRLPDALIQATGERLAQIGGDASLISLTVLNSSERSEPLVSPQPVRVVALGAAAGLAAALLTVAALTSLRARIETQEDVRELGLTPLASLPRADYFAHPLTADPRDHAVEAVRRLRTNLRYVNVDSDRQCYIVTSSAAGEGKSSVSVALASVIAAAGTDVVLVEADLRRPVLRERLGVAQPWGLTDVLAGTVGIEQAMTVVAEGLYVLHAGSPVPNPGELIASEQMNRVLSELSRQHVVVVDMPPLLAVADAAELAANVDGVIVVARARQTRREGLQRVVAQIEQVHGRVAGVVVNAVPPRAMGSGYGSRYGYGYGYDNHDARTALRRSRARHGRRRARQS